ncbi:MAG: hypothetical protein FJ014_05965 [Chloroflexi bacterium]|nr:hypothetical protein [Chloroflexota bacterium]
MGVDVEVGVGVNVGLGVGVIVGVGVGVDVGVLVEVDVGVAVGVGVDVGMLVKVGVGVRVLKMASWADGCPPKAMAEITRAKAMAPAITTLVSNELFSVWRTTFTPTSESRQLHGSLKSDGTRSRCPSANRTLQPLPMPRWV